MADIELIKPRELPEQANVQATDALMVDNGTIVGKATPEKIVNAGAPVASEAEAIAGVNNTKRMTPLRVRQVLDNVNNPAVLRAQAWAESSTPPDPLLPDSKSAKTWASIAEQGTVMVQWSMIAADVQTVLGNDITTGEPIRAYGGVAQISVNGFGPITPEEYSVDSDGVVTLTAPLAEGDVVSGFTQPRLSNSEAQAVVQGVLQQTGADVAAAEAAADRAEVAAQEAKSRLSIVLNEFSDLSLIKYSDPGISGESRPKAMVSGLGVWEVLPAEATGFDLDYTQAGGVKLFKIANFLPVTSPDEYPDAVQYINEARIANFSLDFNDEVYRIDGVRSNLSSAMAVTRNGTRYLKDSNSYVSFAPNTPAISDGMLRLYSTSTCLLGRNDLSGAVAGSPGTLPSGWAWSGDLHTTGGLTRTISSISSRNGLPCMKITWSGTASASSSGGVYCAGSSGVPVTALSGYSGGVIYEFEASSGATAYFGGIAQRNSAGGSSTSSGSDSLRGSSVGVVYEQFNSVLAASTTAGITPVIGFNVTAGVVVNVSIYIYSPQLWLGFDVGPVMVNSSGSQLTISGDVAEFQQATSNSTLHLVSDMGSVWVQVADGGNATIDSSTAKGVSYAVLLPKTDTYQDENYRSELVYPNSFKNAIEPISNKSFGFAENGARNHTRCYYAADVSAPNALEVSLNRFWRLQSTARTGQKASYDVSAGSFVDRAEMIADSAEVKKYGTEIWKSFEFNVVSGGDKLHDWCIIHQDHQLKAHPTVQGVNPPFAISWNDTALPGIAIVTRSASTASVTSPNITPRVVYHDRHAIPGAWYRFVMQMEYKWDGGAVLRVWKNGELVVDLSGADFSMGYQWDSGSDGGTYPHCGIYRASASIGNPWVNPDPNDMTVQYANFEYGEVSLISRVSSPLSRG